MVGPLPASREMYDMPRGGGQRDGDVGIVAVASAREVGWDDAILPAALPIEVAASHRATRAGR